ncbi:MAG TPA: hypothetical protein PK890_09245 [Terrimesophilobacter sp.]|nr:hypothetical protein [Terrimesophilobacter sp.]
MSRPDDPRPKRLWLTLVASTTLALTLVAPASPAFAGGDLIGWGDDEYGVTNLPAGLTDVIQVSTAREFALALHADGTVTAWGENHVPHPSLLEGSTVATVVPAGLPEVAQVVAGSGHALYLHPDGDVTSVGRTDFGQSLVPDSLGPVIQLASTGQHTIALHADGTVTGWGWNDWDQLEFPDGLRDVVQVAAGFHHGLALHRDGTITGWGREDEGQATPIAGTIPVVAIAAGPWHSVAILADGTVVFVPASLQDHQLGPRPAAHRGAVERQHRASGVYRRGRPQQRRYPRRRNLHTVGCLGAGTVELAAIAVRRDTADHRRKPCARPARRRRGTAHHHG